MLKLLVSLFAIQSVSLLAAVTLKGAGASFPYPLYSKWFSEFSKKEPGVQIDYQSIGSGGGIKQFTEETVDFGATDAPMSDEELKNVKGEALHIPTVLGAVVVTYNLTGANSLKLSGDLLAEIFMGKITKWSDPKIKLLNPDAKLEGDILVVHRADGSGTTAVFTDYLAKVSKDWKEKVGAGKSVNWPVGIGGKGNEGVASSVQSTPGSIGYVELIYAENNKLSYASLKNSAGRFVKPSVDTVTHAAEGAVATMPSDFRVSITNASGKDAYPISAFTYLLINKTQKDGLKGKYLVGLLNWLLKDGQEMAQGLFYAPLPKKLVKKVEQTVKTIQVPTEQRKS